MNVYIKRVYEPPGDEDGVRVLVDRLWPRGLSKAAARVDVWLKDISPSPDLRRWFDHGAEKWPEFQRRYAAELGLAADAVSQLTALAAGGRVTLLFGARELAHNNAVVLAAYLASARPPRRAGASTRARRPRVAAMDHGAPPVAAGAAALRSRVSHRATSRSLQRPR